MNEAKDTEQVKVIKPSEIIGIVAATMLRQSDAAQVVYVEGIYQQRKDYPGWAYCYDALQDGASGEEITLMVPRELRRELVNGNLVTVGGLLNRKVTDKGMIQLQLKVTRVEGQKAAAISEADEQRAMMRRAKQDLGFKNVDAMLERKLFNEERPKVALLLAATSITKADFESAIHAARANVDFVEEWVSFANSAELCEKLKTIDEEGFDAVAIVRGGGSGIDKLDDVGVLQVVAGMTTPTIAAVGHVGERLTFKEIVDKEEATPTGLGQYFSELCERVASEKAQSKAVLVEQVRKQFAEQITSLEKRLTKQENDFKEERAGYVEREKKNVEEMANMKGKVAWMANKLNERKRTIVLLAMGLAVAVGVMVWIAIR